MRNMVHIMTATLDRAEESATVVSPTTGARLRAVRDREGLSQVQFAEMLGVARRTLISWERDETELSAQALRQLRTRFDVDPEWVISGTSLQPQRHMLPQHWEAYDLIEGKVQKACDNARLVLNPAQMRDLVRIIYDEGAEADLENGRILRTLRIISQER